jgi:hypothetical protein
VSVLIRIYNVDDLGCEVVNSWWRWGCMLRPITVPATLLQGLTGLRAVERLNLVIFVDRQDDGVRGRIDVEPDDVAQFVYEA